MKYVQGSIHAALVFIVTYHCEFFLQYIEEVMKNKFYSKLK